MRMLFRPLTPLFGVTILSLAACNGAPEPEDGSGGAGGELGMGGMGGELPSGDPCTYTTEPFVELGEGVGSAFETFEDGDVLRLQFASQSGMEASFSVRAAPMSLVEVRRVDAALMVGEFPVGFSSTSGLSCRCADEYVRLDTAIPIDVSLHPDIRSVAQLVEEDADLVVEFHDFNGEVVRQSVRVDLEQ